MRPVLTRSRYLRFSLRALLLFAVVAGLVFAWLQGAQRQRRDIVRMLQSNPGAVLLYDYELHADGTLNHPGVPPGPQWFRDRFGVDYVADIAGVDMFYPTDADIERLARFSHLRRLNFARSIDLTDAGLKSLVGLRQLKFLVIGEPDRITDDGLRTLGKLNSLGVLRMHRSRHMTDAGIAELKRALPRCRVDVVDVNEQESLAATAK